MEAVKQMLIHIKYLYEKKNGLFYHGWSFNLNSNFGGIFWAEEIAGSPWLHPISWKPWRPHSSG